MSTLGEGLYTPSELLFLHADRYVGPVTEDVGSSDGTPAAYKYSNLRPPANQRILGSADRVVSGEALSVSLLATALLANEDREILEIVLTEKKGWILTDRFLQIRKKNTKLADWPEGSLEAWVVDTLAGFTGTEIRLGRLMAELYTDSWDSLYDRSNRTKERDRLAFADNYLLRLVAAGLVARGHVVEREGGTADPHVYDAEEYELTEETTMAVSDADLSYLDDTFDSLDVRWSDERIATLLQQTLLVSTWGFEYFD